MKFVIRQQKLVFGIVVAATLAGCKPAPKIGSGVQSYDKSKHWDKNAGSDSTATSASDLESANTGAKSAADPALPAGAPASLYADGRGALVPWTEFQAEDGQTNAKVIGPNRDRYDINHIEAEAIGRKAVRLEKTGDFVSIKATQPGNSIVVRLSIPDSATGGGIDATLGLYVNGKFVRSLNVTSRYSWVYNGEDIKTPNQPGATPHMFFDETRALIDEFPAGAEIKVQRDDKDTAAFYIIDLIDLEKVGPPLEMPADLVSITDYGAKPDDDIDDTEAFQKAIDSLGDTKKKGVWLPKGTFKVSADRKDTMGNPIRGISLRGVDIRGAGMWYTNVKGTQATFYCWGSGGCNYSDFAILGEADRRDDDNPNNGFNGGLGKGASVTNVWAEHVKVGMWVGSDKDPFGTDGMTVKGSRFRNTYADGINFANGTRNSIVENTHFRNNGDDALAMWSFSKSGDPPDHDNIFRHNTVQMTWRANCFAIYGGTNNHVEDSVCEDNLTYPGIMVANAFEPLPFMPTTTLKNMTLIRNGGSMFGQEWGAVMMFADQGAVVNVALENIDIVDPTYSGLHFKGTSGDINVSYKNVKISNSGGAAIQVTAGAHGKVDMEAVKVTGGRSAKDLGGVPDTFFNKLSGNEGW